MPTQFVSILATLGVVLALLSPAAFAGVTDDGLKYEIADGEVVITGHTWPRLEHPAHLEIPAEIEGLPVRAVGIEAFSSANFTSVAIPGSITRIATRAFSYTPIRELNIPGSVETIGEAAFSSCDRLETLTLNPGIRDIGARAFSGTRLNAVTIPGSVISIRDRAFSGCYLLETVTLEYGIQSIGWHAFVETRLSEIHIPATVVQLHSSILKENYDTTSIPPPYFPVLTVTIAPDNETYTIHEGAIYTKDLTRLVGVSPSVTGHFDVPESVNRILSSAFSGCRQITSVSLPSNLQEIDASAFAYCTALTRIEIPVGVTEIQRHTFSKCNYLEEVVLHGPVTSIGERAFEECHRLTAINLPETVTEIGAYAFYYNASLSTIELPEGLLSIGEYAFTLSKLDTLNIPDSVTSLGTGAFSITPLRFLHIGKGLTVIPESAFGSCTNLREVYFYHDSAPVIHETAFEIIINPRQRGPLPIYYMPGSTGWPDTIPGWPATIPGWPGQVHRTYRFPFSPEVLQLDADEVITVSFFARFRTYELETSTDLQAWTTQEVIEGQGEPVERSFEIGEPGVPVFFRLVSL